MSPFNAKLTCLMAHLMVAMEAVAVTSGSKLCLAKPPFTKLLDEVS